MANLNKTDMSYSMNSIIKKLANTGCIGIKTSFEDEGVELHRAHYLRSLTKEHGLKLAIKIGGPEAKTDFNHALEIHADSVVGPMIESGYAAKKFTNMTRDFDINTGINIETMQALSNIDDIIDNSNVDYFVIGRVDLVGSMNLDRSSVDSREILNLITPTLKKIKTKNKKIYIGGSITHESKHFIKELHDNELIDYIETRYIIMKFNENNFEDVLTLSHRFDYFWNKMLYDTKQHDIINLKQRMNMIAKRCNEDIL